MPFLFPQSSGGGSALTTLNFFQQGTIAAGEAWTFIGVVPAAMSVASGGNSVLWAQTQTTNANGQVFTVENDGTPVGHFTLNYGGRYASFISVDGNPVKFNPGDLIMVTAPNPGADPTMKDIGIVFIG